MSVGERELMRIWRSLSVDAPATLKASADRLLASQLADSPSNIDPDELGRLHVEGGAPRLEVAA